MSAHCNFAKGQCDFANTDDCPKQSVLKHCQVLRQANEKKEKPHEVDQVVSE